MNKTIKLILVFALLFTVSCTGNNKKANQESQLEKCFYVAGLKYEVTIRLTEQPDGKVIGSVISDEYETQQLSANFTGTISEGKINVKFQGEPPIVGDRSEWLPDKPWRLETKNGKEILVITFNYQNFDTNKWEATDWEFEKIECGEISTSKTEEPVVETELVVNTNYQFTERGELKLNNDSYIIRTHETE